MELAATIGMPITEFWEITPYELSVSINGFNKRKEMESEEYLVKHKQLQNLLTVQAYQIATWVWKRPERSELLEILGEKETPQENEEMTNEQMLATVKLLNQMYGGDVIVGTEE